LITEEGSIANAPSDDGCEKKTNNPPPVGMAHLAGMLGGSPMGTSLFGHTHSLSAHRHNSQLFNQMGYSSVYLVQIKFATLVFYAQKLAPRA
jgi:hypothetical protein